MDNIIRTLRAEQGWSQAALAEKLDVSRQSVNAIETGKYDPSLPLAFAIARLRNLFTIVMLMGVFSLLSAVLYVLLTAVDVAFTEAAVGAGIATVLMLSTLALTSSEERVSEAEKPMWALGLVVVTGAVLIYGTLDMAPFGDAYAPIHHHVVPRYLEKSGQEIGLPNVVT